MPPALTLVRQLTTYKWHDAQEHMLARGLSFYRVGLMSGYDYLLVKKNGRVWRVIRHNGVTHVYPSD